MAPGQPVRYFNPRAYVRHDERGLRRDPHRSDFNPRAYVRHDLPPSHRPSTVTNFNPRAYVRHDSLQGEGDDNQVFQSTCLREARRPALRHLGPVPNFNPRAYVRHDEGLHDPGREGRISIHVPT